MSYSFGITGQLGATFRPDTLSTYREINFFRAKVSILGVQYSIMANESLEA